MEKPDYLEEVIGALREAIGCGDKYSNTYVLNGTRGTFLRARVELAVSLRRVGRELLKTIKGEIEHEKTRL